MATPTLSDIYNLIYNPGVYYDPKSQSYRTPGFQQAAYWDDPTPVRAVPEIRTDPTVTPTPPSNSAVAALRGVFPSRSNDAGGSQNGGDITAGLDPLGGQEIGPGGMGWRDQLDAIGRYIGDLMTASPTGNRFADAALMAGGAALGLPPGMGVMAGLARGASAAPYNEAINPWAGTRFDENGQPVTRTGPAVPAEDTPFLPGVPAEDPNLTPVPAEEARFLPTPTTQQQVPAEDTPFLPGPTTTAAVSEKRTGEGDTGSDAGKGADTGGKAGGGDVSASTSAEAGKGDVSQSTGYGDKGGDNASAAGSEGGGSKGADASTGGDVSGSSSDGGSKGGDTAGSGDGGGRGGDSGKGGGGDPGGSPGGGGNDPLARGGRVTARNAARPGNPPGPDNLYATLQTGETVIPRGLTNAVQAGTPGSAMAALQQIRTGAPARGPAPTAPQAAIGRAPLPAPPPPARRAPTLRSAGGGAMAALAAVRGGKRPIRPAR